MKTVLVKGWWPDSVGMPTEEATKNTVREYCIRASQYKTECECLMAYAECRADWSTILDEDDVEQFVESAVEKILNRDYDWLEEHFV